MRDPKPANISGSKQHVFKHQINWSHVALAVVLLVAISQLSDVLGGKDEDDGLASSG